MLLGTYINCLKLCVRGIAGDKKDFKIWVCNTT